MEVFAGFICPNSPNVWDGNWLSTCFVDMVFGFGVNAVTVVMLSVLWFVQRNVRGSWTMRMCTWHKLFIYLVPALGVCLSFYDMIDLFKSSFHGQAPVYYKWFFRCSQFASWMTIMLFLKCENWSSIFCYWIMCIWWIVKPLLQIPHLQIVFSTSEAIMCVKESSFVVVEIIFGVYVNIFSVSCASTRDRTIASLEDPLLSSDKDMKGDHEWSICNYWNLLTFKYANTMMDHGVVKQLDFEDLIQLPDELLPSTCHSTLLSCWVAEQSKNQISPSLFCALFHAYGWPYLRLGLLKVTNDAIGFLGPVFLNKLIKFLQRGSGLDGYILAISLGLTSALKSFLDTQYTFRLSRLKLKLRSSIMTIVYCKCLHVSLSERSKFSEGEIQTFMSIDADRTVNLCNSFHDMWSLPLQIGVALYLLYTQVKFAFVSGIALTILLIPVNKYISTLIANATVNMMKEKDERIRTTGELLTYIRTLKMYGWELLFAGRLLERRTSEVKHLSTRKYLDAWCVFFWATTPSLFSLSTFGLYTLMGNQLDAATVFTCVALFNNLISPLNSFPWVITGLIDAIISTKRLSKFFSCSELTSHTSSKDQMDSAFEDMAVIFRDACLVWSDNNKDQSAVLNGISLDLPKRSFIAVIGEIGSGKSSLLYSILREMQLIRGSVKVYGSLAYVSQVPWILSCSLRDNILFGKEYDAQRYIEVLQACALDLDISRMARGDLTYIGEKGYNLSGGQRARLALARAIYHGSDICILDDVLSAVDSQVASWILQNAILSPLMDQKTCVMCTHNVQAITVANTIVIMDKGHLKWAGNSANFLLSSYSTHFTSDDININSTQLFEENSSTYTSGDLVPRKFPDDDHIMISEEAPGTAEIEEREEGNVALSVYKSYATFSSLPVVFLTCVSAALMQASRNGNDMWLSHWVDTSDGTTQSAHFYLVILLIFCTVNSLLTLVRAFSFSYGGLRAAVEIHSKLLRKLINARVSFFDRNPSGRILNRFSSDLYTIDDSLPFIMNILLANFFSLVGIAIILCYAEILFLLLLLPLMYIYRKLQFYYRSTSRELRRLDSVSRSPIYTSFTETLDGASTIRAFNAEEFFMSKFIKHVALYQRTSYSELSASLWLSLRLQLMAASVISFLAMVAVFGCRGGFPISFGTPGLVGLALSYATPVVSLLSGFLTTFTETEKEMVSVERVLQYMDIPQEELQGSQSLPADWPLHGNIEFEHVTLRYTKSSMDALKGVSFNIAAGMQVGIVGRTGAGKSSVINALFRLNPISHGHVLVDGLNIANIPVRDLRAHLAVVPQSPFLFEGRLRENIDPSGLASDSKIWEVLEKCHVKEEIEAAGGLDIHVKEAGVSFSVGQRQLICLARALLKSSKVLCLDECTANVDAMTTSLLQKTLFDECKGITVIMIAHRISVVMSMDNILILDNGLLVEQGNPQALLQDQSSRFSGFARASMM